MSINKNIILAMMFTLINVSWGAAIEIRGFMYNEGVKRYAVKKYQCATDGSLPVNFLKGYEISPADQGKSDDELLGGIDQRLVNNPNTPPYQIRDKKVEAHLLDDRSALRFSYPESKDYLIIAMPGLPGLIDEHKDEILKRVTVAHIGESLIKEMFRQVNAKWLAELEKAFNLNCPIFVAPDDCCIYYNRKFTEQRAGPGELQQRTEIVEFHGHQIAQSTKENFPVDSCWRPSRAEFPFFSLAFAGKEFQLPSILTPASCLGMVRILGYERGDVEICIDETNTFLVIDPKKAIHFSEYGTVRINLSKLGLSAEDALRNMKKVSSNHQELLNYLYHYTTPVALDALRQVLIDPSIEGITASDLAAEEQRKRRT